MTVITHPRRKSNLATMIDSAGGLSIGVALAQARANLERAHALGWRGPAAVWLLKLALIEGDGAEIKRRCGNPEAAASAYLTARQLPSCADSTNRARPS